MYLMIDNYDSFVYNLKAYFEELGREILVKRSDEITLDEIEDLKPEGIILSPGPKRPRDAAFCVETVRRFQKRIPILGVCLGHQVLGYCSGATVEKGERPMHGKVTEVHHKGTGLFAGLPERFRVTRYHSLIVRQDTLPEDYEVDCISEDGAVMERIMEKMEFYVNQRAQHQLELGVITFSNVFGILGQTKNVPDLVKKIGRDKT